MNKDLLHWDSVKDDLDGCENTVLLGNGFSRSYKSEEFNQQIILSEMESLKNKKLFDIEKCIKDTIDILRESDDTIPKDILAKWIKEKLHKEFIGKLFEKCLLQLETKIIMMKLC